MPSKYKCKCPRADQILEHNRTESYSYKKKTSDINSRIRVIFPIVLKPEDPFIMLDI